MSHDVFISYSSKDKTEADILCAGLEAEGIRCWIAPRNVPVGSNWASAIIEALRASRLLVLLLSSGSNASEMVAREVERATATGLPIVPVVIEDVRLSSELEYFLSTMHWFDARPGPLPERVRELANRIRVLLGREETSARTDAGIAKPDIGDEQAEIARKAAVADQILRNLSPTTVRQLADVVDKIDWTVAPAVDLPQAVRSALPYFERAARHVGQSLALQDSHRREDALTSSLQELAAMQGLLPLSSGNVLEIVGTWRDLITAELASLRASLEASRPISNPFVFGNPITETDSRVFTGRDDVVRQVEESIANSGQTPLLFLHGFRRMGKTSILNQLPRLLGSSFVSVVFDCQSPAVRESAATLLYYLTKAISTGLRRRGIALDAATREALTDEPFAVFDEWLDRVEHALPDGTRVMLCLDEYERLQTIVNDGWGCAFLDALRHVFQHRPRITLMFTGVHTFSELGPEWTDRFISARRIRVNFLTRDNVMSLLTEPTRGFEMTYADGALETIYSQTNGQPFLTQAVAFELVQLLNEHRRRQATATDVEQAVVRAATSADSYLTNVWNDAGDEGRELLRAIACGKGPPAFPKALGWLRENDILNEAGDFAVPMVKTWVRREKCYD
jgi:hypothetical protein